MRITYDTSAAEDAGLAYALARANALRAAQEPPLPALTAAQYLRDVLASVLASYVEQAQEGDAEDLRTRYRSLSPADREAVKAALAAREGSR